MKERYVRFNVQELMRAAAHAANKDRCASIVKMAEGGFNKVFLITMDDGSEVVARIPTAIAGPRRFSTASEVATLDLARNILNLPVPAVLAYSCDMNNPVGTEYIIMERIHGDSLASRWLSLSTKEIKEVMTQLVKVEEKAFSFEFPASGSLYLKQDVNDVSFVKFPPSADQPTLDRFCIGPIAKRQYWADERQHMDIDRGPCWFRSFPGNFWRRANMIDHF